MQNVIHNGEPRSFSLCVLRGDGWGCAVLSDRICYQIRRIGADWHTTGIVEDITNFIPPATE